MRIQTNIFLTGFLAFVVPLTILALAVTYYSQAIYMQEVKQKVNQNLLSLSAELERRLLVDRELTMGLSKAPAVQAFLPLLDDIDKQKNPPHLQQARQQLDNYFAGFRTIIQGIFFIRVLDSQGNTLVKVSQAKTALPIYESLSGIAYVEQEINSPTLVQQLRQLPKNEVSAVELPHNKAQSKLQSTLALLDYVIPLYYQGRWVGALSITLLGEYIDHILTYAPRSFQGKLLVVENNPDHTSRHGLVLYDDEHKLHFAQPRPNARLLSDFGMQGLLDASILHSDGSWKMDTQQRTVHYLEIFPYSNQLVSWLVAINIDNKTVNAPFTKTRISIWVVALIILLISLIVTQFGTKGITTSVSQLGRNFDAYAKGEHDKRARTDHGPDEIRNLALAFNHMADTLSNARKQRDQAEQMMLQSSKLASIGQMAAGIGHEINNPLNNILSYTKLLLRETDKLDKQQKQLLTKDLQSLREEALRASEIVKGIMNFARQVPPQYTCFDIHPWLESTLALVQQSAKNKTLELELDDQTDQLLEGDRNQLQQALINLLLNAIHASPTYSKIILSASTLAGYLTIKIIDQGEGIQPVILDRAFDPFFTTREQGHGTGLGLSISLGIIQRHNGTLRLINNRKRGVTATLTIPLKAASPQKHETR